MGPPVHFQTSGPPTPTEAGPKMNWSRITEGCTMLRHILRGRKVKKDRGGTSRNLHKEESAARPGATGGADNSPGA